MGTKMLAAPPPSIHVNRVLRQLREKGLFTICK
jgi:hypothetical protein